MEDSMRIAEALWITFSEWVMTVFQSASDWIYPVAVILIVVAALVIIIRTASRDAPKPENTEGSE